MQIINQLLRKQSNTNLHVSRQSLMWPEQRNEGPTEVEGHDLVGGPHESAADEDRRNRAAAASATAAHPHEGLLDFLAVGIAVDIVDQKTNVELVEEYLNRVAQAARALAEDQDPVFRRHFCYLLHFSLALFFF